MRQAGKHLQAAGYVVEEILPPDLERGVELWHMISPPTCFGGLWPQMQKMGDPDGIAAMRAGSSSTSRSICRPTGGADRARGLLFRWMTFFQQWPLVILPTLADLPPKQVSDIDGRGPERRSCNSMRPALLAPLLGLPGLAVPVGSHGKLRTGVQIMAMRNREDLCLDAGEVIEAAEGVVKPIDPVRQPHRCIRAQRGTHPEPLKVPRPSASG